MNILELRDERSILLDENKEAVKTAKAEMRKLNEGEMRAFDANIEAIEKLDKDIDSAQAELKETKSVNISKNIKMDKRQFNLLTAIRNRAEGRAFDEESLKVIDAGKAEMRKSGINPEGDIILPTEYRADILAGTATQGEEVVAEDKLNILKPLRESLVMVKAGATYLTGLTGDVSIPAYGKTSALWKGEVGASEDGAGAFSEINLAPMRLTAHIDVSKQFLAQDSASAEAMLKQDIVSAIVAKLEGTILGDVAAVPGTNPGGFFATDPTTAIGVASFANVVALETAVDTSNALIGNLAYITNAAGRGILKTTDKGTDTGQFLLAGNELNGYPILVSNHVADGLQTGENENGIVFGNFADYVIAQWGGIDLIVDPYTVATEGQVRLVVNAYFDAKPRRTASFATGSIK